MHPRSTSNARGKMDGRKTANRQFVWPLSPWLEHKIRKSGFAEHVYKAKSLREPCLVSVPEGNPPSALKKLKVLFALRYILSALYTIHACLQLAMSVTSQSHGLLEHWFKIRNTMFQFFLRIKLAVVLYGCEAWSLTLREECRLRVFENMILRRVFGPKRDENGEWRRPHNEELHSLYPSPNIGWLRLEDWDG